MAVVGTKRFVENSVGTTSDEYTLDKQLVNSEDVFIELDAANSGTIQFDVALPGGTAVYTTARAYAAGSKIITTVPKGYKLHAKGSAAAQKFMLTY